MVAWGWEGGESSLCLKSKPESGSPSSPPVVGRERERGSECVGVSVRV